MLLFHDRLVTQAEAVRHGAKRVCRPAGEQQNANGITKEAMRRGQQSNGLTEVKVYEKTDRGK